MEKMYSGRNQLSILLLVVPLFFLSCLRAAPTPEFAPSGFLEDYSQLHPSTQVEGRMVYAKESKKMSLYKMLVMAPVQVYFHPESDLKQIPQANLDKLARYFEAELRSVLSESYPIVEHPGFGVMRLRIAIANIKADNAFLNVDPETSIFGLGLEDVAIEAEISDSQTGERLAAFVDSQPGERFKKVRGFRDYAPGEELLHRWALALNDWLKQRKGLFGVGDFRSF